MDRHSSEIANSILFDWRIPTWLLKGMGAIPGVSPTVHSRLASVVAHGTLESVALLGLNMPTSTSIPAPHEDPIQSLIGANQHLWEDFVNHPFPRQMARGTAPLNGFRHYMIVSNPPISVPSLVSTGATARRHIPRVFRSSQNALYCKFEIRGVL